MNLGLNVLQLFEPAEARVIKAHYDHVLQCDFVPYRTEGFTRWDKIVICRPDCTLAHLIDLIRARYGVTVDMICCKRVAEAFVGSRELLLYNGRANHLGLRLTQLLAEKAPRAVDLDNPSCNSVALIVYGMDASDRQVDMPLIIFQW